MSSIPIPSRAAEESPEPAWEVAQLFPAQGTWSEEEYLSLKGNRLVEFSHGWVEVLLMPTTSHQTIVGFLYAALFGFISPRNLGKALFAPLRVKLWAGKFREPDVIFMLAEHRQRVGEQYWDGADLAMEVVSDDDRRRDLQTKRFEYARAGIPEYWIIDPQLEQITVLVLEGDRYREHGCFHRGQRATSVLLAGFELDVEAVLKAE